jgi:hypothetical protein
MCQRVLGPDSDAIATFVQVADVVVVDMKCW